MRGAWCVVVVCVCVCVLLERESRVVFWFTLSRLGCGWQGLSPRISPFAEMQDVGALMQRAKFTLLTVVSRKG